MLGMFGLLGLLAIGVIVVGFVFYLRLRTLRQLQALMASRSKEADDANVDAQADAAMAATLVKPRLTVYDGLGQLPGAVEARERFVRQAVSQFRRALAVDAAAALGYAVLPLAVETLRSPGRTDDASLGIGIGVLYLLLAALRYLLYRTQFRAIDQRSRAERVVMAIVNVVLAFVPTNVHVMTILKFVLSPRVQVALLAGWIVVMVAVGLGGGLPGLVLAAVLHLALAVWFAMGALRVPGKRLVVLRVFGLDKNAEFLFDGVLGFWKHFGHFFTVVDPAYWRHSHRILSLGTLLFVGLATACVAAGYLLYGLVPGQPPEELAPLVAAAVATPLLAGYARFSGRQVDRTFIRSKSHLDAMLARFERWPRHLDMTYKSLETRCFDNTWKVAVAEFARRSDVVVMDLRGYSSARAGCTFEVNYLLDAVPVERIVFLLDDQTESSVAGQLILDAWQELRADSPNLASDAPEIRLYVATSKDERDIQGVIDLLINAASRPA